MSLSFDIAAALHDPRLLEDMYRKAKAAGHSAAWAAEIARLHEQAPDNLLLAAWHYRLQTGEEAARPWRIHWQLALPLGLLLGLVYWVLTRSDMMVTSARPYLFFVWAPLAAVAIVTLVGWPAAAATRRRAVAVVVAELVLTAYCLWLMTMARTDYQDIVMIHLPIVALVAVGLVVAGPGSDDRNRFAFLIKATEAVVTGAIIGGASMIFVAITFGIFDAIGVQFPDALARALVTFAAGLTIVLAVAVVYDARFAPLEQRFEDGMSKLISTLGRFFLPLTLVVAVAYVLTIPFNFWRPFEQRDVLIVYNLMLFAVMGLLVFAAPVATANMCPSMRR